ncbi:hypothetical protein M9Y10_032714 [Tritrichomonas musculus]|uniref:DUF3447 domain-containing protein n=1 Tax=Tritrichomonas musculus TaxID=1915356 RepID=A0ABR2GYP1_9EUKA
MIIINKMKNIEKKVVSFLENPDEINENFSLLNQYWQKQQFSKNKYELKSFLYIIDAISNNYHRSVSFFTKIELILKCLQEKIQSYFVNFEIFNIFHKNKRLLLFLFKSGIITPNEEIYFIIKNNKRYVRAKYLEYFYPEFEPYIEENIKKFISDQIPELNEKASRDEFDIKRESGENDSYICQLIQKDSVVDFITYIEKTKISPNSTVQPSIYETNLFLIDKNPTLIEYSAFYGSIQIFKYLYQKNLELDHSIWLYAIHGKNAEIIRFLEEHEKEALQVSYPYLIIESIKCHHNDITDYFRDNVNDIFKDCKIKDHLYRKGLKYYNFSFFTESDFFFLIVKCTQQIVNSIPYYLCKYDHYLLLYHIFNPDLENEFDVNHQYKITKPQFGDVVLSIDNKNKDGSYYSFSDKLKYSIVRNVEETSTILNVTARKGNIDIIKFLIGFPSLNVSIKSIKKYQEPKFLFTMLDEYNEITEEKTILHEAVESGYAEVVQFLLANIESDVNCAFVKETVYNEKSTAHYHYYQKINKILLHFAIEKGNIEIVKLLLSNPNINVNLESTSTNHNSGGCISYSSSTEIEDKFSLYFAIKNGNIKMIQLLLDQPQIDVNLGIKIYSRSELFKKLSQEKTPLFLATENENLEILEKLKSDPRSKLQNNQIQ